MALDFSALDDAVIARLEAQAADFRAVRTLDEVEDLVGTAIPTPSAHTLVERAVYQPPPGAARYQEGAVTLAVYVRARNARGYGAARKEAGGAYALVQATVAALRGYAPAPPAPCGPLELVDIAALSVAQGKAIYAVRFRAATSEEY